MQTQEFFKVEKIQLGAVAPQFDEKGKIVSANIVEGMSFPEAYGVYRTDTNHCLGVVGSQYVPVQNNALFDVVSEAADLAGLNHESIRFIELGGGRKVAFQVELPEWDLTGDKVKRYASALNSHDGSSSLAIGAVGVRIICQNTWVSAYRGCSKARHSASIVTQVGVMKDELLQSLAIDKELFELFQKMQKETYSESTHEKFIKELVGYDLADLETVEANTTKRENKYWAISNAIDVELQSAGRNMWGVFNGVTRYTNHDQAVRKDDPNYYLYFGGGKQLVGKALDIMGYN